MIRRTSVPRSLICRTLFAAALLFLPIAAHAQAGLDPFAPAPPAADPLTSPSYSADVAFLFNLEKKFAQDTAAGGGAAFAKWFAADAVTLSNGQAPVIGSAPIAAQATWSPADYQLTWTPEGGRMGPGGNMGFTWGHYAGRAKDKNGNPIEHTGRYMTVWKKQADGSWKVEMDASNDEPAQKEDCCKLP
jgi:ketosteroid isomerase-like protein